MGNISHLSNNVAEILHEVLPPVSEQGEGTLVYVKRP